MTAANLLPADVQQRADAELGAAWRRCEAALPEGWKIRGLRRAIIISPLTDGWVATARGLNASLDGKAATPVAALTALAEALEARREYDHVHDPNTGPGSDQCAICGQYADNITAARWRQR